jgi:hypothetical protein
MAHPPCIGLEPQRDGEVLGWIGLWLGASGGARHDVEAGDDHHRQHGLDIQKKLLQLFEASRGIDRKAIGRKPLHLVGWKLLHAQHADSAGRGRLADDGLEGGERGARRCAGQEHVLQLILLGEHRAPCTFTRKNPRLQEIELRTLGGGLLAQ